MSAITLLSSALLLFGLDQASKVFVLSWFREKQAASFAWIGIRGVLNQKINGFSASPAALLTLWVTEVVLLIALVQFSPFFQHATAQVALGAALGGASSNLLDKLCRGGVVDFIDVGFWPVFNLADTAIIVGGLVAVLYM